MILHAADADGLAVEIREDAAKSAMQFLPQRFILEKGAAFFRGEDEMDNDLGE